MVPDRVRRARAAFLSATMIFLGCAGVDELERFEFRQRHMGTEARIVLFAPDTLAARTAATAAFSRIAALDAALSDYRADSELSRLSNAAGGPPVAVSAELLTVLAHALSAAAESGGAFDPTAGPVVALWREARRDSRLPAEDLLAEALAATAWRNVVIDTAARTVRLARTGMRLDLGGIAKGYAADRAIAELRAKGITRAMIEFGGDIVAAGPPPAETGWLVRIEGAADGPDTVRLANAALSTSGDSEQHVVIDGVRYSHVVDPRTGIGLTDSRTATVLAPSGIESDALATTATLLTGADLAAFIARHPESTFYVR